MFTFLVGKLFALYNTWQFFCNCSTQPQIQLINFSICVKTSLIWSKNVSYNMKPFKVIFLQPLSDFLTVFNIKR